MHYDNTGLIVHLARDGSFDGGDTGQREGWYWLGVWIRSVVLNDPWPTARALTFNQVISLLEPGADGVFYRNPTLPPWNNPYDKSFGFSRDQMTPLVAAMGGYDHPALRRLWNALPQDPVGGTKHTFNGSWTEVLGQRVFYTGDIIGPSAINLFRRSWHEDPLPAGDGNGQSGEIELAANVPIRIRAASADMDDTGDDLNSIVMLLWSHLRFPSATSEAALNLYIKERPLSYGSYLTAYRAQYGIDLNVDPAVVLQRMRDGIAAGWRPDEAPIFGAIKWYHREEVGANPELAELYRPIVAAYFTAA